MPSLNVAPYYAECMESVLNQSFTDIEIIAVDAGSTDGTLDILNRYAKSDSRIKVIHSPKKSYGAQMNMGIEAAEGEYVGIVETDDVLEKNCYEKLLTYMERYELDYVKGIAKAFWDIGNGGRYEIAIADLSQKYRDVICPSQIPELLKDDIFIWLGLYKKSFIKEMKFNETNGAAYQDQGFLLQTIGNAKRAMYLDSLVYYYRQDNVSASQYSVNGFRYIFEEYKLNHKLLLSMDSEWENFFYMRYLIQSIGRLQRMAISKKIWSSANEYIDLIREQLKKARIEEKLSFKLLGERYYLLMSLFLCSPQETYNYFKDVMRDKYSWVLELLNCIKNKKVVIWGCGKWGKFVHTLLKLNNTKVRCFIDKDPVLWGQTVQGSDVVSPKDIKGIIQNLFFVIAVKKSHKEIMEELYLYGVNAEAIYYHPIEIDTELFYASVYK